MQRELVECCRDVLQKIVNEVQVAPSFFVLADEATNAGNVKQMSIDLRNVDGANNIREQFAAFVPCLEGTTGKTLAHTVTKHLQGSGGWISRKCYDKVTIG